MSPISTCLRLTTVCAALILCSFVNVAPAQSAGSPAKANQAIPVQAFVPTAPIVFHGDGSGLLCYEIYLTNMSKEGWA